MFPGFTNPVRAYPTGAVYPKVGAKQVQLDESEFKSLAVRKSEICASYSKSNKTLLLDVSINYRRGATMCM